MRNYKELIFSFLFGALLGLVAKYLDTVPMIDNSPWHTLANYFGDLFTRIGIWVFIAILIAVKSKKIIQAALNTLLFSLGMLITYYIYSAYLFGFFPTLYFLEWGKLAIISPFLAMLAHLAKHDRNLTNTLPALPIGLMLYLSLGFGYLYISVKYISEFIMLLVIGKLYYRNPKQIAIVISLSIILALLLRQYSPYAF